MKKEYFFFPLYFWYYLSFPYKLTSKSCHQTDSQLKLKVIMLVDTCLEKNKITKLTHKEEKRRKWLPKNQLPGFPDVRGGRGGKLGLQARSYKQFSHLVE